MDSLEGVKPSQSPASTASHGKFLSSQDRATWLATILAKLDKGDSMIKSLYEFYVVDKQIYEILPIIDGQSNISIRVLDWFVTNYSKKFNVVYPLANEEFNTVTFFNVYLQYKSQLKGYKKKMFDPFCRKKRIYMYYEPNLCCTTTIGQLNFFRWAIKNKVLDYVETNLDAIIKDMNSTSKQIHVEQASSSCSGASSSSSPTSTEDQPSINRRTRHELSQSSVKSMTSHRMNIVIDLN
jgi:hypothetical protein